MTTAFDDEKLAGLLECGGQRSSSLPNPHLGLRKGDLKKDQFRLIQLSFRH
jgi:hypothetical protein